MHDLDIRIMKNRKAFNTTAGAYIIAVVGGFIVLIFFVDYTLAWFLYGTLLVCSSLFVQAALQSSYAKARTSLMLEVAHNHNLTYYASDSSEDMRAHIFKYRNKNNIEHVLRGIHAGNQIAIFLYQYSIKSLIDTVLKKLFGISIFQGIPNISPFTVCQIQYTGTAPHMIITNLKHDKLSFFERTHRKKLVLGNEFNAQFSLFVPEDFQGEVSDVLTSEMIHAILARGSGYSFEFVDHDLFLYVPWHIQNIKEFNVFVEFGKYFSEILEHHLTRTDDISATREVYEKPRA